MDELEAHEQFLISQIEMIRTEYQKQIEPYIKELVRIRNLRPLPIVILESGQPAPIGSDRP